MGRIPASQKLTEAELWETVVKAAKKLRESYGSTITLNQIAARASRFPKSYGVEAMRRYLNALPRERQQELFGRRADEAHAIQTRTNAIVNLRPRMFRRRVS